MDSDLDRRLILGAAGLAGVAAMARLAKGGPISPPPGAVGSTGRTTDELWSKTARTDSGLAEARIPISAATTPGDATHQYIISQPGSYYLTGDLVGLASRNCIGIAASGVNIDLNGYALDGVTFGLAVIKLAAGSASEISIRNGQIRGCPAAVAVALDIVPGVQLIDLIIADAGRVHLGDSAVVERCSVLDGRGIGLQAGDGCVVRACLFKECSSTGLQLASGTVESCAAIANGLAGFLVSAHAVVRSCVAVGNGGAGVSVGPNSVVTECSSADNATGISANTSVVDRCTAVGNSTAGIVAGTNCVVTRCVAQGQSAGTGISVSSSDVRVESCQATDNLTGFSATSTGSIFIANTASGNTSNYSIAAANFGLFVTAASIAAAVNGASGGTALGTTDPRANLSF